MFFILLLAAVIVGAAWYSIVGIKIDRFENNSWLKSLDYLMAVSVLLALMLSYYSPVVGILYFFSTIIGRIYIEFCTPIGAVLAMET